jgi:hypothetical protein
MCGNCVTYVIICSMGDFHCNFCNSKSKVHKSCFLQGSIATNDWFILLTIKGNWFEVIMHMTKFEFLKLVDLKQVQLLVQFMFVVNFNCKHTTIIPQIERGVGLFFWQLVLMTMSKVWWNANLILKNWIKFQNKNLFQHYNYWL